MHGRPIVALLCAGLLAPAAQAEFVWTFQSESSFSYTAPGATGSFETFGIGPTGMTSALLGPLSSTETPGLPDIGSDFGISQLAPFSPVDWRVTGDLGVTELSVPSRFTITDPTSGELETWAFMTQFQFNGDVTRAITGSFSQVEGDGFLGGNRYGVYGTALSQSPGDRGRIGIAFFQTDASPPVEEQPEDPPVIVPVPPVRPTVPADPVVPTVPTEPRIPTGDPDSSPEISETPEPTTLLIAGVGLGFAGLSAARRRVGRRQGR